MIISLYRLGMHTSVKIVFLFSVPLILLFPFKVFSNQPLTLKKKKKKTGLVINHQLELFQMDKGTQEGAAL